MALAQNDRAGPDINHVASPIFNVPTNTDLSR
jgi:hypothetical protein